MRIFILFTLFTFCANSLFSQVEKGLVAKYSFNNGNAEDEIKGNDGSISDAYPTKDRFSNERHAMAFSNSYVAVYHDENLNLGMSDFSISFWFKCGNVSEANVFVNKGQGTGSRPRLFIRTLTGGMLEYRVGDGNTNVSGKLEDASEYLDNDWHHLVLVREGNVLVL